MLDVTFQFAGDRHLVGAHAAGQLGAGLNGEIALDVHVALELAGDAHAAAAFDLAFDGDVGGDQRFLAGQAGVGACDWSGSGAGDKLGFRRRVVRGPAPRPVRILRQRAVHGRGVVSAREDADHLLPLVHQGDAQRE